MPAASRSANTSGSSASSSQWSWTFWRVGARRRPRRSVRDLADRAQLCRRQDPGRDLDAQHERADLRLVVVEAPPLEADDVLLGDALVALAISAGSSSRIPSGCLFALQALDGFRLRRAPRSRVPSRVRVANESPPAPRRNAIKSKGACERKAMASWNCQDARMIELRRISDLPPYAFAAVDQLKRELRRAGTTSSTSASATRTSPHRRSPSTSSPRPREAAEPPLLREPRHPDAPAGDLRALRSGASASSSIPRRRRSRRSARRKASRT